MDCDGNNLPTALECAQCLCAGSNNEIEDLRIRITGQHTIIDAGVPVLESAVQTVADIAVYMPERMLYLSNWILSNHPGTLGRLRATVKNQ